MKADAIASVYFVRRGPFIKIGISERPKKRAAHLRYANVAKLPNSRVTEPVELLLTIPGCRLADERQMHERFGAWRFHGEWFHGHDAFLAELACLRRELADQQAASDESILRVLREAVA